MFRQLLPGTLNVSHYVLAFVFLVRLVVLIRLTSSPLLLPTGSDMHFYNEWAKQILHGRLTDHQAFYGLPLYPYLVAFLYRLFGDSPFVPGFFQACLEGWTAALIYKITVQIFRSATPDARGVELASKESEGNAAIMVGLAAAAGWAFFVPAQAYSVILMPTAWSVFAFWFLVWQVVRAKSAPSARRCFGLGLLIGVAAMGIASILFLAPLIIAALYSRPLAPTVLRSALATRSAALALFLLGVGVGTSPCWIHNYFIARDPVLLSAHGGINLWLGNNPEATGYPRFPGLHAGQAEMLRDSIEMAETAAGRHLKRSEVSQYWSSRARDFMVRNIGPWLKLMARKFANFWNAFEYDDLGVITNLREHRVLFPGLHFGVVAALAFPGLFFSWRAFPASRWMAAAIALHLTAVLAVFVTERYRLTVVPGLLIFASLGLHRLWTESWLGNYRNVAIQLVVVAAGILFVTMPRNDPSLWALEAYNSGRLALDANNLSLAERDLQRAYAYVPDNAEISFALGNLRLAQGDSVAAKGFYETTLRLNQKHKGALNNLGVLALDGNQPAVAVDYLRHAVTQEPRNAKTHYLLAKALAASGNQSEARAEAARALELDSAQPEFKTLNDQLRRTER